MTPTLNDILSSSISLLGASKGNLQLYDKNTSCLRIAAQVGFHKRFLEHFHEVRTETSCACGNALKNGTRFILENVFKSEEFPELAPHFTEEGLVAVQSTPLRDEAGEFYGVVSTHFARAHRPTDHELQLLDSYLGMAGSVISAGKAAPSVSFDGLETKNFIHVFLFECGECSKSIGASTFSPFRNLEVQDGSEFDIKCSCSWSGRRLGATAKSHTVTPWLAPKVS